MKTYSIEFSNGTVQSAESLTDAENILLARFPENVQGPRENAGPKRERILVWETEAASINDDGAHAVAQIIIAPYYTEEDMALEARLAAASDEDCIIQSADMARFAPGSPELHCTMTISRAFTALTGKRWESDVFCD